MELEIECVVCEQVIRLSQQDNIIFNRDWFTCPKCKSNISLEFHSHSPDEKLDPDCEIKVEAEY